MFTTCLQRMLRSTTYITIPRIYMPDCMLKQSSKDCSRAPILLAQNHQISQISNTVTKFQKNFKNAFTKKNVEKCNRSLGLDYKYILQIFNLSSPNHSFSSGCMSLIGVIFVKLCITISFSRSGSVVCICVCES